MLFPSAQHPSGLTQAHFLWGPRDRLINQRGSGEARRFCEAGAASAWNREGVGAPDSTPQCPRGRHQGDEGRLFRAMPGGQLRGSGTS